jgi:transcriptional regulator with XRE-family HTH domain
MLLDKISPVDAHIAKKLRQFRLIAGLSQDKLGELTGVTFQQIQKYEKAKNRVSASRLFEFSQILEKPINAFFEGIKADRSYYNYDFKTDDKLERKVVEIDKEILPLIRAFNKIESAQSKKNLVALVSSISGPKNKKTKHAYS